jgi:hypothetical protein
MDVIGRNSGRDAINISGGHGTVTCTFLASRPLAGTLWETYAFSTGAIPAEGKFLTFGEIPADRFRLE